MNNVNLKIMFHVTWWLGGLDVCLPRERSPDQILLIPDFFATEFILFNDKHLGKCQLCDIG